MGIFRSNNPTQYAEVDGIIIDERSPPASMLGVPSNIAICVGQFQRGPSSLENVGSAGNLFQMYGRSDTFSGNIALMNKRFGRLKVVRVIASDAEYASKSFSSKITFQAKYKGAYGNNIQVKIENADSDVAAVAEVSTYTSLAASAHDVSGAAEYFLLNSPTVGYYVWFRVTDGNTQTDPAVSGRTGIQVNCLAADTAAQLATKLQVVLEAHAAFTASVLTTVVTITNSVAGAATDIAAGTSGATVVVLTQGVTAVEAGVTYTIHDNNDDAVIADEVYKNIVIADITSETFAGSLLCDVTVDDDSAEPSNAAFTALEDGDDGTVADSDYESALNEAAVEGAGNILFLDAYNTVRNGYMKVHAAATEDKLVLVAGPESQTVSAAVTDVALNRDSAGRIVYCYPWVKTTVGGVATFTSPASWVGALISQIGPHIDPAYTANTQFLAGVSALKLTLNRSDYITLKEAGICAFENDPDVGFKIKSGIVTQITDSSKIMILRRRMADYLTYSGGKFLKNYQNAVNSVENRKLAASAILNFIQTQERDKILPSDTEVQEGLAKLVDSEVLNTNESIAQGFFKILWKQRIFSSMRFIVLQAEIGESVVVTAA